MHERAGSHGIVVELVRSIAGARSMCSPPTGGVRDHLCETEPTTRGADLAVARLAWKLNELRGNSLQRNLPLAHKKAYLGSPAVDVGKGLEWNVVQMACGDERAALETSLFARAGLWADFIRKSIFLSHS